MLKQINSRRVILGGVLGAIAWVAWGFVINFAVLGAKYSEAQKAGHFLEQPLYGFFPFAWIGLELLLALICAALYAAVREGWGPGPGTALRLGLMVGFAAGFPLSFAMATWSPASRIFPLWWMLELWVGAILATLVAGWNYRE
jgi:hypothetical protein